MHTVGLLCMVLAVILLLLAASGVSHPKIQFGWLGLMFWALWVLVGMAG